MTNNSIPQLRTWLDYSETITGLILSGKLTHTAFNPDMFMGEYAKVMKDIKSGMSKEDLYAKYTNTVQIAQHAGTSVNGLAEELDWVELLSKKHKTELMISELPKLERYLESGDMDKAGDLFRKLNSTLTSSQKLRSIPANEIIGIHEPYILSGSPAIDLHLGGVPKVGLTVIGAKTYTGKTTIAISIMDGFLKQYPDKRILFVTLEDMNESWKARATQILGERSDAFWSRVQVMEFAENPHTIIEEASRFEDIGAVFVDYLDFLVDEANVASFAEVYKSLSTGSKSLAVNTLSRSMTIFLLAQFGVTKYRGGVPTPNALPYVDQKFTYQLLMLYQPDGDIYSDDDENAYYLPAVKNKGYVICWKSKNARPHDPDFPGAIQVPWTGRYGYDLSSKGEWFSLASETKQSKKKK